MIYTHKDIRRFGVLFDKTASRWQSQGAINITV